MAKAYLLAASLMFCFAALTRAQAPGQSNAHYTLRGSVVNSVTGEPIHKAVVNVNGAQARTATTGPDGQFEMEGLQPGTYYVSANRPGYVDPRMTGGQFEPVQLGPDTGPLTVKLVPFGRIAGRVIDTDGEPVPNSNVQALMRIVQMGHANWQPSSSVQTDENGNFVVDMLQPGHYLLTAGGQDVYPGMGGEDQASRLMYRKQYFPNSPDIASAQPIDLTGGESVQADLTLPEVLGAHIYFSVIPQQPWVQVTLLDANGDQVNVQTRRDRRTGQWIIPGVAPGSWHLDAQANANGVQFSGSAGVEVGNSDVRNVVIEMSAPMQVPVVFAGEPEAANVVPPANFTLISASPQRANSYGAAPISDAKGTHYTISGLPPGNYHAQISPTPSHCVDSVTAAASDLARVDYVVPENGTPQPISVSLGSDCGTIDFSTTKPALMFSVVIVGGVHALEPLLSMGGNTVRVSLAPGEYDVYAFPDANNIEYANPDMLKNYVNRHISVSSGQNASYKLDLNSIEAK